MSRELERKLRYERLKAEGKCVRCLKPLDAEAKEEGHVNCSECSRKQREYIKIKRRDFKFRIKHSEQMRTRYEHLKSEHRCTMCGVLLEEDYKYLLCEKCRSKSREANKRSRMKERESEKKETHLPSMEQFADELKKDGLKEKTLKSYLKAAKEYLSSGRPLDMWNSDEYWTSLFESGQITEGKCRYGKVGTRKYIALAHGVPTSSKGYITMFHGCDEDCLNCEYPDCLKPAGTGADYGKKTK